LGGGVDIGARIYGGYGKFETNAPSFSDLDGQGYYIHVSGGVGRGIGTIVSRGDNGVSSVIVWKGYRLGTPVDVEVGRYEAGVDTTLSRGR
jgi:hypothetical protein